MFVETVSLASIGFDKDDQNLFQVDDPRLRADALKHSILPRLLALLNHCLASIRTIYEIEVLANSRISTYPNFRTRRKSELTLLYDSAYVGLGGQQVQGKWTGVERKDGKPVKLLPFRYGIQLTEQGLVLILENYWLKGLTDESHKKFFDFHLRHQSLIHTLCYAAGMSPSLAYGGDIGPIATFEQHYNYMLKERIFDNNFYSEFKPFSILSDSLAACIHQFVCFFPVYDSYLQIARGGQERFEFLIGKLNTWLKELDEKDDFSEMAEGSPALSDEIREQAREAAAQKVKVMPSIRWQVFQRDNWKCVACGRGASDGVILHVDHILPRSKGGMDEFENYQTLCHICNLGKSNRDATKLRKEY
ncbi:MAG: HNH endonuclease [Acidobacteriota bacterium]